MQEHVTVFCPLTWRRLVMMSASQIRTNADIIKHKMSCPDGPSSLGVFV